MKQFIEIKNKVFNIYSIDCILPDNKKNVIKVQIKNNSDVDIFFDTENEFKIEKNNIFVRLNKEELLI